MSDAENGGHLELLRQQTALARFGEFALRSDDLDEILTEACRLVGEALGTDLAKVMELRPDGHTVLVRAGVGWKPGIVGVATTEVEDDTSEGHALKTGEPMVSPDIAAETRFRYPPFLVENGVKAVANVLILGGKGRPPFGLLQIDSREPRAFTDDDVAFLRGYANLLAAAVDRLRVLGEVRGAEARLRESAARQQAALETGLIGFFEWDVPSGTVTADRHFARFYGLDPAAAAAGVPLGSLFGLIHPDDRAAVAADVEAALASSSGYAKEFRLVHPGGEVRWMHVRGRREHGGGRAPRYVGTAVDVTASKAAEAALRRSNEALETRVAERTRELVEANVRLRVEAEERGRVEEALRQSHKMEAVGQLTGGIAHDFNNMLQGIAGGLELMRRRVAQGRAEEAERLGAMAAEGVKRAAALTHRLLAFARRQALDPKPVEPNELVAGMAELIRRTAGPGVAVELRPRDGAWSVSCDANQLENALLNLAINASDAMPDGGRLTIATADVRLGEGDVAGQEGAKPGEYVEVSVSDTGAGMTPDVAARAFEPFFTTKPIGQGTGLGLSQLYGFVRQSGGLVRLESAPGRGTTVRVLLPRHAAAPGAAQARAAAEGQAPPADGPAGGTVLLVEDEASVRASAAEALRERGHAVLEAADGPAGLRVLQSAARVDLLVTDVGLPGLNGRQLAEAARERRPGLPVLLITGYAGRALDNRLAPGMEVIGKPFALDALAAKVRAMLEAAPGPPPGRGAAPRRP